MVHTLVTGGCGFIGRHLVRALLARGEKVVVVDDLSTGRREALAPHPRLALVVASVLERRALARAAAGADRIYHLAGVVGMRLATSRRDRAYRTAREGTANLLALSAPVPTVLFSSSAVYGLSPRTPSPESPLPLEESNLVYDGGEPGYSLGKRHLEELGREEAARGRPVLAVRPFNVAGPGQSGAYGMVLPTFVDRAAAGAPLPVYGDGSQTRTFSGVERFVETLIRLTAIEEAWELPDHVVNLGARRPLSIMALARRVIALMGSSSPIEVVPFERVFPGFQDAPCRIPDTGRAESLLGRIEWPSVDELIHAVRRDRAGRGMASPLATGTDGAALDPTCHP